MTAFVTVDGGAQKLAHAGTQNSSQPTAEQAVLVRPLDLFYAVSQRCRVVPRKVTRSAFLAHSIGA